MSEFITIQVGQCGNQIGGSFWPLILEEYGFPNIPNGVNQVSRNKCKNYEEPSFCSFFNIPSSSTTCHLRTFADLKQAKIKARAILVDMEDSVIQRYRTGPLRDIFDSKCTVTNYPGSGNNWGEGFCHHGPKYKNKLLNKLRRAAEKCDNLQGFLLLFSVGGGTGSGLGTYILKLLADHFSNVDRLVTCIYPTGTEDVITCPYNMALATRQILDHASCTFPVENRALLNIVEKQARSRNSPDTVKYIVGCKPYQDMNNVVGNMLLHLTSGSRFSGKLNIDINELCTNMIPFPNMHFLSSGFGPLTIASTNLQGKLNSVAARNELFTTSCSRSNQLVKIDPLGPKSVLLSTALIGRGNFSVSDMKTYSERIQAKGCFTAWSKKSIKFGLCNRPPTGHAAAMLSLFNTTNMAALFIHIYDLYKKVYRRKAHVHHYTQIANFDADYFEECENSLLSSIESYKHIETTKPTTVPRLRCVAP